MATATPQGVTPDRRERRRQDTRERIIAAALALFRTQGYAATSVDAIAERADVARRTLFNHFPRKQDLLAAWAGERRARLSALAATDAANALTGSAMLRRQFEFLIDENESDVTLAVVLVQGWLVEIGELTVLFPVFASFRDAIDAGQRRAEFTTAISAEAVSEILTSVYLDTLGRWVHPQVSGGRPPFELRSALMSKLDVILAGLRSR